MKRRNLSGVFLFDRLPYEDKRAPTCFEDCRPETQEKFMDSLDVEGLKRLVRILSDTLAEVGYELDIYKE
jgi:hypothetical protein